jgi:hypothetical protein
LFDFCESPRFRSFGLVVDDRVGGALHKRDDVAGQRALIDDYERWRTAAHELATAMRETRDQDIGVYE